MVGMWAESRAKMHAGIAEREMPQTEADQKKRTNDAEVRRAKKFRKEHDAEYYEALSSPKHFGAFLGMAQILGEPERIERPEVPEGKLLDTFMERLEAKMAE